VRDGSSTPAGSSSRWRHEQTIAATRILIATGSEPSTLPSLPFDGERVVSSTEALTLPKVPGHLLVIGGGAIGLELGSVWLRLGAKVTVVEFLDRIVPMMDRQMGVALQKVLQKQGMTFQLQTAATNAERTKDGMKVTLESKGQTTEVEADVVLVSVGRRPHTDGPRRARDRRRLRRAHPHRRERALRDERRGRVRDRRLHPGSHARHKAEEEGTACRSK
jgi:dihydrolipoamide dehydrogenase